MHRSLFCLVLAACSSPGLLQPPGTPVPTATPRTDGFYWSPAKGVDGADMIRFQEGGKVRGISAKRATVGTGAAELFRERAPDAAKKDPASDPAAKGTYTVTEGVIRFTLASGLGSVEYAAVVQGDKLAVRWRSDINGETQEQDYKFVGAVALKNFEELEKFGEGAPAASADGDGWHCFQADRASRCERRSADCEASQRTAAAVRRDAKVTACTKVPSAYCFTVQRGTGRAAPSCSQSQADCDAERTTLAGETSSSDVTISACARQ